MKYFKWNYNDGKFNFGGIAKVYNGLNFALFSSTNAFYAAFHRTYKGHSIKELDSICLTNFTKEEIKGEIKWLKKKKNTAATATTAADARHKAKSPEPAQCR